MQHIAQIQTKVLEDLKLKYPDRWDKNFSYHKVFTNYRNGAGLRVNRNVYLLMKTIYDCYPINFFVKNNKVTSKHLVGLDKHLTMPWYIDYYKGVASNYDNITNNLYLFGQQDAFILKLYSGNLELWLKAQT